MSHLHSRHQMSAATTSSLVGSYVALQINPMAMVAEYVDSPILAVAKALGTRKYVALVEKEVRVAFSSDEPVWRVYRVSFVGRHSRTGRLPCRGGCLSIFSGPSSANRKAFSPLTPSRPLPQPDCCHRLGTEALIRVYRQPYHLTSPWSLSDEQMKRLAMMRRKTDGSTEERIPDVRIQSPSVHSCATSVTVRQPIASPSPRAEESLLTRYGIERRRPGTPPLSALAQRVLTSSPMTPEDSRNPYRVTTPASNVTSSGTETPISDIFDRARMRHNTMDSASVYSASTVSTSIGVLLESPSMSKLDLTLDADMDMEDIPLVDISYDLDELDSIVDPREFLEEHNAVVQLVQKARVRRLNSPEPSLITSATEVRSFSDVDSRRLSLVRARSRQSQAPSRFGDTSSVPPIPPLPAKLRKPRSVHSYRPLAETAAQAVRAERRKKKETNLADVTKPPKGNPLSVLKKPVRAMRRWLRYIVRLGSKSRRKRVEAGSSSLHPGQEPNVCA